MTQVLPISLQALQNDTSAMERIGANLANSSTPAYRREISLQQALLPASPLPFSAVVDANAGRLAAAADAPPPSGGIRFDTRHGTVKGTDQPLDVALLGAGFFEVQTDAGPAYTRNGQFRLDARGRLVTGQGHPVMGRGGEIMLSPGPATISATGEVSQGGRQVAQIKVVDFDTRGAVEHPEGGLYATPGAAARPLADADVRMRQGALENSNVDPMTEMVDMVQVMRHFESMARVVQNYDDMMGTAIRQLGQF